MVITISLFTRVDGASAVALRVIVGTLVFVSALRFIVNGWVETFFVKPTFFFSFYGFDFIQVLPETGMTILFATVAIAGLGVATGTYYRLSAIIAFFGFTYIELVDVTNYLNHYYLISLLLFWFCWLPLGQIFSVDAWRLNRKTTQFDLPRFVLWGLRAQVACVYFFAAIAKAQTDWLMYAQPLNIWFNARADFPIIGSIFDMWPTAFAFSWAGFLFDLTIVLWLLIPTTRKGAYAVLVAFHCVTGLLFNIGLFPMIMIGCATIFFAPNWPRFIQRIKRPTEQPRTPVSTPTKHQPVIAIAVALFMLVQILVPLRTFAYGGNVLWHEQGMRWSWRVMVREKNGSVSYRVVLPDGKMRIVEPTKYLTDQQAREFSGQPDLILQLAQQIGDDYTTSGAVPRVFVDAKASLNGRPLAPLIDPTVDLMQQKDNLRKADWILPSPTRPPPKLGRFR